MKKRVIKVVKRDAVAAPEPELSADDLLLLEQKEAAEDDREMASTITGWIKERRKNNDAEEKDAANSLFAWEGEGTD